MLRLISPRLFNAEQVVKSLDYVTVVDALAAAFRGGVEALQRHHHVIPVPSGSDATLMPAWMPGRYVGTTQVFPENGALGLPCSATKVKRLSYDPKS